MVVEQALQEKAAKVTRISIEVGDFSGIVAESLQFCLDIAASATIAEAAEFSIVQTPLAVFCRTCNSQHRLAEPIFICPQCGGVELEIVTGRELIVRSFEIETADEK